MSILAPLPATPFRDPGSDLFAPSGAATSHAEFPPSIHQPSSTNLRVPFPIFPHRHTSPYPMSFSALGTPPDTPPTLHTALPPPAPKVIPPELPIVAGEERVSIPRKVEDKAPSYERRVHVPEAMVKLAPPADDGYEVVHDILLRGDGSETPRRSPISAMDLNLGNREAVTVSRTNSEGKAKKSQADMAKRRSMGPPPRPKRANTTYPNSTPSSVRMEPSRSADSRARVRAGMPPRSQTFSPHAMAAGPSRSSIDLVTPPRNPLTLASDEDTTDLGGPDGLEAKVVLLGSQGVGKTSLILRYTTRTFSPSAAPATIGSSLHTRKLVHGGVRVKLQIWDTAGQERFRSMAPIYYRGAHVCVLVYDISNRQSFEDVRSWLEELGKTVPKETVIYVVGAKIDLERKRAVSLEEAKRCIRFWTRPPPPPPTEFLSPPPKSLFRSTSRSDSLTSHTPTRSNSHGALAACEVPLPQSTVTSVAPTPARQASVKLVTLAASVKPIPTPKARPPPALKIIASSPRSSRRVSFPALQSPSQSITGTTTEHVNSSITPSSPTRHGVSGGRFSISGVLGMSRTESMSGAVSNLARLVEEYPVDASRSVSPRSPTMVPVRVRTESTPLLGGPSQTSGRRKSEDWSSRSWRMGGGPGAAEALGEFGASIKKKESEELLSGSSGSGNGSGLSASSANLQEEGGGKTRIVRSRGGSLGRDSRLYPSSEEEDIEWGVEVGGVRLGECSALTGEGVEALFKSISSLLVQKKDKIERERQLRRKNSVMLVDPTRDALAQAGTKGRFGCCA